MPSLIRASYIHVMLNRLFQQLAHLRWLFRLAGFRPIWKCSLYREVQYFQKIHCVQKKFTIFKKSSLFLKKVHYFQKSSLFSKKFTILKKFTIFEKIYCCLSKRASWFRKGGPKSFCHFVWRFFNFFVFFIYTNISATTDFSSIFQQISKLFSFCQAQKSLDEAEMLGSCLV